MKRKGLIRSVKRTFLDTLFSRLNGANDTKRKYLGLCWLGRRQCKSVVRVYCQTIREGCTECKDSKGEV